MFKNIQEFESFAREYSDVPVKYEHGNLIDFYAHIILRGSGDWLSFRIRFEDKLEAIETDVDVYEAYLEELFNLDEAFRALSPRFVFQNSPEMIELMIP
jgi:hypothetical protein